MDPVLPADAVFLWGESRETPTHVLGLQLFEPPEGVGDDYPAKFVHELTAHADVKASFRRAAHRAWSTGGQWVWRTEEEVDLTRHVYRSALPSPGGPDQLFDHVARLHETLLDTSRPLWEFHVVEGLADGRFAVCSKLHHSLFDGMTMSRHLLGGLSTSAEARDCTPPWATRRSNAAGSAAAGGVLDQAIGLLDLAGRIVADLPGLVRAAWDLGTSADATAPFAAPRSPFNGPISAGRVFAGTGWGTERLRRVATRHGVTTNDVVLAMCGGALRSWLSEQGELPDASLTAMVPVSLRPRDGTDDDARGNAFGAVLCELGTDVDDAGQRVERVARLMAGGKERLAGLSPASALLATGAVVSGALLDVLPLPAIPRAAFNLIISNVPMARETLYWNGARLADVYPLSMLLDGQGLNITVTGYAGTTTVGLTGCHRSVPRVEALATHLDHQLALLEAIAP